MKTVAHQLLVMELILELASQLDIDIPGVFNRYITCMYVCWNGTTEWFCLKNLQGKVGWGGFWDRGAKIAWIRSRGNPPFPTLP